MFRIHPKRWFQVLTLLGAFSPPPAALAQYYFTAIDPPGSISTQALGLNDKGVIVGAYSDASGVSYGFVDDNGAFTQLAPSSGASCGSLAGICNQAWGVNNAGAVVGSFFTSDGAEHGFLYSNGNYTTFTQLDAPGAEGTAAFGVSNNGIVVGQVQESSSDIGFTYDISTEQYSTFSLPGLPAGATFVPFGINDSDEVVGSYVGPPTITPNPGGGGVTVTFGPTYTFLYTLGSSSYTLLPQDPDAVVGPLEGTLGSGINDVGDLAGNYTVDGDVGFGFLPFAYLDGAYVNFSVFLPSDPSVDNSGADGINNLGDIVGYYSSAPDGEFEGFLATPVPEASSWAMALLGFAALGFVGHRARAPRLLRA